VVLANFLPSGLDLLHCANSGLPVLISVNNVMCWKGIDF
jgi:hypothetical protein